MKKGIASAVFFIILLALSLIDSYAAIKRLVAVSYDTKDGWSEPYIMEVEFATGRELNKATKSYNYSDFSKYALVWFNQNEVAIIELNVFCANNNDFDNDTFKSIFRMTGEVDGRQVNDEDGRAWNFYARDGRRWLDPRVTQD